MPTLTPTFEDGARSVPQEMTAPDPGGLLTDAERGQFLDGTGLNGPFVADLLSDMLCHERCGVHLYRSVAARTNNPVLKRQYEHFGEETVEHVDILETLIGQLGGDPLYVSPSARATEKSDTALVESTFMLAGSVDVMTQELVMLDAVMLAEAKDHANWSGLSQLVDSFPEGDIRARVREAVAQVEPQEDDHLGWAQETRTKLISLQVESGAMATVGAKAEEAVARIKDWLS
jgi:rubrerythrin